MDLEALRQHMDERFDRVETKIDGHAERITRTEERIDGLRGFAAVLVTILLAIGGFFANAYFALIKH